MGKQGGYRQVSCSLIRVLCCTGVRKALIREPDLQPGGSFAWG